MSNKIVNNPSAMWPRSSAANLPCGREAATAKSADQDRAAPI
jgi:hypothetical protein